MSSQRTHTIDGHFAQVYQGHRRDEDPLNKQSPLPRPSYPRGGGEHVLFAELEAVDLVQDHSAVVFALEEVGAAEYGGGTLGFASLNQHCGGGVVGLHTPGKNRKMLHFFYPEAVRMSLRMPLTLTFCVLAK